jgi:hypothetical protein
VHRPGYDGRPGYADRPGGWPGNDGRDSGSGYPPGQDGWRQGYDGRPGRDGYRQDRSGRGLERDGNRVSREQRDYERPGREAGGYRGLLGSVAPAADAATDGWRTADGYRQRPDANPAGAGQARGYGAAWPALGDGSGRPGHDGRPQRPGAGLPRADGLPPELRPERPATALERTAEVGSGHVSYQSDLVGRAVSDADRREDDTLTRPLPVILPGATALPRPGPIEAPRGPFEPARPQARPASITGSVEPPPASFPVPRAGQPPAAPPRPIPDSAVAKLDQIKDLYLTAEAIGEDALDKHFDEVSERQRKLIREFFERSGGGGPC